jgi:hypothetical protein
MNKLRKYMHYTATQEGMARILYECDGLSLPEIAKQCGINHYNTISRWAAKNNWKHKGKKDLVESIQLNARLEKAKLLGLSDIDQLKKAKQLMEAKTEKVVKIEGSDAYLTVEKPDYKIQNEGLKRAMELTGTKIEKKEVEHTGSQEVVHRYQLPEKRGL